MNELAIKQSDEDIVQKNRFDYFSEHYICKKSTKSSKISAVRRQFNFNIDYLFK